MYTYARVLYTNMYVHMCITKTISVSFLATVAHFSFVIRSGQILGVFASVFRFVRKTGGVMVFCLENAKKYAFFATVNYTILNGGRRFRIIDLAHVRMCIYTLN